MVKTQRTPRCLNDYVLPPPGSMVCGVCGPTDPAQHAVYTVVASKETQYPGNWRQYILTLVGRERLIELDVECSDFHHNWHVLLRPGYT